MDRRFRLILIIFGSVIVVSIVTILIVAWSNDDETLVNQNQTLEDLNQQKRQSIISSAYEKILYVERPSGDRNITTQALSISDFLNKDSAVLDEVLSIHYSNFLPETNTWFSVRDNILFKHTLTSSDSSSEELVRLSNTVADVSLKGQQISLAVAPNMQYIAWVHATTSNDQIILYDLTTNVETVVFTPENTARFTNLTWSPDSNELAFTDQANNIITITPTGAQLENPFAIPYTEFNHLSWIENNHFAAVATSTENHPEPFNPKVIVFSRQGEIIEDHDVLEHAGIPRVLWSPDATQFMFFDQWKNYFVIYDRFNTVTQLVSVEETGKLIPLGWTIGTPSADLPLTINPTNTSLITFNNTNTTSTSQFSISAEQWDQYNETTRAIVKQFKADMSSYRFEVTSAGITIHAALLPEQTNPEAAFVQIILQTLATLPNVPTVSLDMTYNETDHLVVTEVATADVNTILDQFTTEPLENIFVVNKKNPIGKPRTKTDTPNHTYFADLVYSRDGDYNPIPVLAALDASLNGNTFLSNAHYAVVYPTTWQIQKLVDTVGDPYQPDDILFYTAETNFSSPSSWSGFSVIIRSFQVPAGVDINTWLLVNRNDRTFENVSFPLQSNLQAKKIVTNSEYQQEYVMQSDTTIFVITMDHPPALTPEEIAALEALVASFSDNRLFER